MDGVDAVVNFAAETHVDRSIAEPDAFVTTHALGTWVLLEAARDAGVRYVQVSTDEVYGSIDEGSFTESSPLDPSSPYSATKAGADLLVGSLLPHVRHGDADLPRLQQLRAVPVPREAHPADGAQRPARRLAARLRRRHAGAQLALRARTSRAASATCWRTARRARPTTSAGRTSCPNIEVVKRHHRAHGQRRVAHRVRHRPPGPRPPLLARLGEGPRARLGGAGALRRGPRAHRRVVPRQRRDWWEPIRSGDYRAYYERQYGKTLGSRLRPAFVPGRSLRAAVGGAARAGSRTARFRGTE